MKRDQVSPHLREINLTLLLCFVFCFQYFLKIYIDGKLSSQIPNDSPETFTNLDVYYTFSGPPANALLNSVILRHFPVADDDIESPGKVDISGVTSIRYLYYSTMSLPGTWPKFPDYKDSFKIAENMKIVKLPVLGPFFSIKFKIRVTSFPTSDMASVLHFTTGDECCKEGDRVPAIFIGSGSKGRGSLFVAFPVGGDGEHIIQVRPRLKDLTWYTVRISHDKVGSTIRAHCLTAHLQNHFKIEIDGKTKNSVYNEPKEFTDVFVFAGLSLKYPAADGLIKDLKIRPVLNQKIPPSLIKNPPTKLPDPDDQINIDQDSSHLIGTLDVWGPAWVIQMKIKVSKFPSERDEMANILHVTAGKWECCEPGSRVPAVFLRHDGKLLVVTDELQIISREDIKKGVWTDVKIAQSEDVSVTKLVLRCKIQSLLGSSHHHHWRGSSGQKVQSRGGMEERLHIRT